MQKFIFFSLAQLKIRHLVICVFSISQPEHSLQIKNMHASQAMPHLATVIFTLLSIIQTPFFIPDETEWMLSYINLMSM